MLDATILAQDAGYSLARMSNLAIVVWHRTPTANRARVVCDSFPSIASQYGLVVLTILQDGVGPPDSTVRKIFDSTIRVMDEQLLGNALVIQFGGVRGSLVRAVARTLSVISRSSFPIETFSTVTAAVDWVPDLMASRGGPILEADHIVEQIARMLEPVTA